MINLIPTEEKKRMIRDFYMRFGIVFLTTISLVMFAASAALLPAYFFAKVKKKLADENIKSYQKDITSSLELENLALVSALNKKLNLIENSRKDDFRVTEDVINSILVKKMSDIKIKKITYSFNENSGKKIEINGSAPSRERLLMFRMAFENDTAFTKVDLPISNFVRGSNIQFFLTLTVK